MGFVTVLKLNLEGQVTWQYTGKILQRADNRIVLEARFNREDTPFHGMLLKKGDRFVALDLFQEVKNHARAALDQLRTELA